jgi:cell division protein FtsX
MKLSEEALNEFKKKAGQQIQDIIDEANTLPSAPASEKENLDIIKHLIKRLANQQVSLNEKAKWTNRLLIILSIIMAISASLYIVSFFCPK